MVVNFVRRFLTASYGGLPGTSYVATQMHRPQRGLGKVAQLLKNAAWIAVIVCSAGVIAALVYVDAFRYALPLVYPAPPEPDYMPQALIAWIGCAGVAVAGGITGVAAHTPPTQRKRSVRNGCMVNDGDRGSSSGSCANHPLGLMQRVEPPTQVNKHSTCQTGIPPPNLRASV